VRQPGFPSFYKSKAIIAMSLREYLQTYPNPKETFSEFARRMRPLTGMGYESVKKLLEEDYPEMTIIDDKVTRR
jgi:hypothetical protein